MNHSHRYCAGVKVCSFFPSELRSSHTEMDSVEGYAWSKLLTDQANKEAVGAEQRAESLYNQFKNAICENTRGYHGKICGGRTVIRSFNADHSSVNSEHSSQSRIFIGCENWQPREKHHRHVISNYDPIALLKLFGRNRCRVYTEILDDLGFDWAVVESEAGNIDLRCVAYLRKCARQILCRIFECTRAKIESMYVFSSGHWSISTTKRND